MERALGVSGQQRQPPWGCEGACAAWHWFSGWHGALVPVLPQELLGQAAGAQMLGAPSPRSRTVHFPQKGRGREWRQLIPGATGKLSLSTPPTPRETELQSSGPTPWDVWHPWRGCSLRQRSQGGCGSERGLLGEVKAPIRCHVRWPVAGQRAPAAPLPEAACWPARWGPGSRAEGW